MLIVHQSQLSCLLMKVFYWWNLSIDESCLLMKVMKVVYFWKLSIYESCPLMKVVNWWKLSIGESYLLMKVEIVQGLISCDILPVAMFILVCIKCSMKRSHNKYAIEKIAITDQKFKATIWAKYNTQWQLDKQKIICTYIPYVTLKDNASSQAGNLRQYLEIHSGKKV